MILAAHGVTVGRRLLGAELALEPGQVTAICGPNGAGKSTLLGALAGLIAPDGGEVRLDDRPLGVFPARERAKAIGYLPQTPELAWDLDVATLAGLGRLPWRSSAAEDRAAITEALAALDLTKLSVRPLSRLSGGERARALLARVLAGRPRWVLADEPLAALDLAHQAALLERFRALAASGVGVVAVLHDLAMARNHADRVIVLDRGRVVADGAPGEALSSERLASVWGVDASWISAPEEPTGSALIWRPSPGAPS
jgi:iron complex transport system ATP-binding protein